MAITASGPLSISLAMPPKLWPAADVLFQSLASRLGKRAIGIVLSGCLYDGAAGVTAIRSAGGHVFVHNPDACQHCSMPLAAMSTGAVDLSLPVRTLAAAATAITMAPGGSTLFTVRDHYRASIAKQAWAQRDRFYIPDARIRRSAHFKDDPTQ